MGSPRKTHPPAAAIRGMFDGIARRYDLLNRLMTLGQDCRWRGFVARRASLPLGGRLLDIGTGTGGIAREALAVDPTLSVVAADFSLNMMRSGRTRRDPEGLCWCSADALALPFPDRCFDAVTSGYLIRNVTDAARALREQHRVLRPGGRIVCLDTSPPRRGPLYPLVMFHFKVSIPLLGGLISGHRAAYAYLPESTRAFMTPGELASAMERAGFERVAFKRFMFGTIAVHWGIRP